MPGYNVPVTKDELRLKIKEIREREKERILQVEEKIKALDRRSKFLSELKAWMGRRKLSPTDLLAMYRDMAPKRAASPVKSKNPLQPKSGRWADLPQTPTDMFRLGGKLVPKRGDPKLRSAIHEARIAKELKLEDVGRKIGVSGASIANWEQGRNVPKEEQRLKLVKFLGLDEDLGKAASAHMTTLLGRRQPALPLNGGAEH